MLKSTIFGILIVTSSWALGKELTVTVNGMVCSFCAQGIHKKLTAQESVKTVYVNLKDHVVKIDLKDGKDLEDKTITQILSDAGYTIGKIERAP